MEVVAEYHTPYISDIHDGRILTGSYVAPWFQPVQVPEIYGARDLCLDPNNIEYYCISEEERQRRLNNESLIHQYSGFTIEAADPDQVNWVSIDSQEVEERYADRGYLADQGNEEA